MARQPDTWSELGLVGITLLGGSEVQFATITETVDIDIGDKDFDAIATLAGGRLVKFNPQDVTTITLEAYPLEAGTAAGSTGEGFFHLMNTIDASQPQSIAVDHQRDKYQVVVLWTEDTTVTTASSAVTNSNEAMRIVVKNGYFTGVKPAFTDGVLKFTVTFKCPPFNKAGTANVTMESTDGTGDLAAVGSYS